MENENIDLDLQKALTVDGADTGDVLVPERVDPGIRRFVETSSPLYNIIRRREWDTMFYEFRQLTALPQAQMTAEGAVAAESEGTYEQPQTKMKFITTRGKVSGPAIAATRSVLDIWMESIETHTLGLVRKLEQQIIAGAGGLTTGTELQGLSTQIQLELDASGDAGVSPSPQLTLAHMDEAIDLSAVPPTHIVNSRALSRRLWSLLQAQQRFVDRVDVEGGFRVPTYQGIPIIRVDNDHTALLPDSILFIDNRHIVMPTLQELTFENLGKVDDHEEFFLKMYTALAVEGVDRHHVKLTYVSA